MEACPKQSEDCPFKVSKAGCRLVMHHLFYPRRAYEEHSDTAAEFRDLSIFRVPMCAAVEMKLHQDEPNGPPMPSDAVMEYVVDVQQQITQARGVPSATRRAA